MIRVLAAFALLWSATSAQSRNLRARNQERNLAPSPYLAQNGLVVMEAESVPIASPWMFETDIPGYNGTGYLRFDGGQLDTGSPLGTMSYFFAVDKPGTWHMRFRARKINEEHPTWQNDCYTKLVGHPGPQGTNIRAALGGYAKVNYWAWRVDHMYGSPPVIEIPTYQFPTAGVYELQVSGRTKHFMLDRIILYHADTHTDQYARDPQRPESPRQATEPTAPPSPAPTRPPTPTAPPTPAPTRPPTNDAVTMRLVNSKTNEVVLDPLTDNAVYKVPAGEAQDYNIEAVSPISVANVRFDNDRTEGVAPYARCGDNRGDFYKCDDLNLGTHTVSATPAGGTKVTLSFTISEELPAPTLTPTQEPTAGAVPTTRAPTASPTTTTGMLTPTQEPTAGAAPTTGTPTASPTAGVPTVPPTDPPTKLPTLSPSLRLDLTTAGNDSDQVIQTLTSGDVIKRYGENLSILAEVLNYAGSIGKVDFKYNGRTWRESFHPYAMAGNGGSKNYPVNYLKSAGQKTVTVIAYDTSNNVIVEQSIAFEIV